MTSTRCLDWELHLVSRAQAGERVAFELLADLHREALRAQALRTLRDPDDANDAVQETLLKAYRALHSFRPGRPVLPWLSRICSNCCVDVIRGRRRNPEPIEKYEYMLCDDQNMESDMESRIDDERIRQTVARLPRHYREIVEMRHFHEMEVAEIARVMGKPEGTVKSWLFRARGLMRKDLEVAMAGA